MRIIMILLVLGISTSVSAQWRLRGEVEDTQTGKPLKGVTVTRTHSGKVKTVESNKKGKFKVPVKDSTDVIIFEKEGYYSEQLVVKNAKRIRVGLTKKRAKEDTREVTDSYGSQGMKSVTSAVTILGTQDFNKGVAVDIYELLRGKVPGLMVRRDSQSPNSKPVLMLRGTGSGTRVVEPMIVLDGNSNMTVEGLDPNDVESVQVLRDGSAQAMYGSTAAGGVIIIKTKKK